MSHHDRCSAEQEFSAMMADIETIEDSIELGNQDPGKAEVEKDQVLESLYDIANRAEELIAHIQRDGLPYGRCGSMQCCHCKGAK